MKAVSIPTVFVLVVTVLLTVSTLGLAQSSDGNESPDLIAVNLADTHSAYDAYPRILAAVEGLAEDYADKPLVFLFNGDLFELGNAAAAASDGEADWEFLRRLRAYGRVVVNIGNHEFDFVSPDEFVRTAVDYGVELIGTIADGDGKALTPAYTDLNVAGRTIRVVGVATDQMNTYPQEWRELVEIPNPVSWTQENYADLAAGADYAVLLSHAGLVADRRMLRAASDNTLFAVGGHDHLVLREEVGGVAFMHNGFRGERFNVTEIHLPNGAGSSGAASGNTTKRPRLVFDTYRTAEISGVDEAMAATIEQVRAEHLSAEDQAEVGTVPEDMSVLEAAMWSVETVREAVGADVAFLNHTSFGSRLNAGPLPKYRFDQFMRFDNDVMRAEVDGETLRGIMALSNQHTETPLSERTGDFLYTSGLSGNRTIRAGRSYEILTSSWVALDFNQEGYLGTTSIEFEQVPDVTTKGILTDAMN